MRLLSLTLPDGQNIKPPTSIPKGGIDTVKTVIGNAFTLFLILAVVLSLIFTVIAGIQWITSGGDKNKLQAARARLTWAITGLIISFVAFGIVGLLGYVFGVNLLKLG